MRDRLTTFVALLTMMAALAGTAEAGGCCGGSGGSCEWLGPAWLDSTPDASATTATGATEDTSKEASEEASDVERQHLSREDSTITPEEGLRELENGPAYVPLYVSNSQSDSYIKGTALLPSRGFLDDSGALKPISDIAQYLASAGITEEDSLVLYGDCFSCGDATFVLWIMKYLGHEDVRLLEGTNGDWTAAGLPMQKTPASRPSASYTPDPRTELLADYDFVSGGNVQIVDARTADQFAEGHIEGAVNLDYNQVIENGWIKSDEALAEIFGGLDKEVPVVVYSKNGGRASIVWYALQIAGYDARLYTWRDWLAHQG